MDSPILPILLGGGVLAAIVLGTRKASAQDDEEYEGDGSMFPGPINGDGGGFTYDPNGGDDEYSDIPGGAVPPRREDEPGRPALEPGQGRLLITIDPRVEPGTLYVIDRDGWGGRYGSTTLRSWDYRDGKGMTLDLAVDPGEYEAFVRSRTQRTESGQRRKVTVTGRARVAPNGNIAIYLRPNEYNRAGERQLDLTGFGAVSTPTGFTTEQTEGLADAFAALRR